MLVRGDGRFGKRDKCIAIALVYVYGTAVCCLIDLIGAGIITIVHLEVRHCRIYTNPFKM
jgi:hypothetical protein